MIIYNVTIKLEATIETEYMHWLQNEHLKEMMQTGLFVKHTLCKLIEPIDDEGVTYIVQYYCEQIGNYHTYIEKYSQEMREKGLNKFGNKFIAFRTVMEVKE